MNAFHIAYTLMFIAGISLLALGIQSKIREVQQLGCLFVLCSFFGGAVSVGILIIRAGTACC